MDGREEEVVGSLQSDELQSCGHRCLHVFTHFRDTGIYLRRIGVRCLEHHEDCSGPTVDVRQEAVALGTYLHLGYIA